MADRVHPSTTGSPPRTMTSSSAEVHLKPSQPAPEKPVPPPGTYVIQVPKDQIYRYPPPENSHRFEKFSKKKPRRSCCCRCLCWTVGLLLVLLVLAGVAAGVLYLVFRPEAPDYTVDDLGIRGVNLTSSSPISPRIDVTVRAQNPNDKIGIYYEKGSSVNVFYNGVNLCNGVLPAFYQPSNNLTVFKTALRGSDIVLSNGVHSALVTEQRNGRVPLRLNMEAPVKIKIGAVKTWTLKFKVKCDLTVDKLTAESKIVSKDCDYSVKLW